MVRLNVPRWIIIVLVAAVLVLGAGLVATLVLRPWSRAEQPVHRYPRAIVATSGVECSEIGKDILLKNGSAADAAIAMLFCEGVSCAQCMGLGGGFLLTVYSHETGQVEVLNARETAPKATTADTFEGASSTTVGALTTATPGELRGYGELHRRYGRLPWAELVKPTADLCRNGHVVSEYMARVLGVSHLKRILEEPTLRDVYIKENGKPYEKDELIKLPLLAETLDTIAEEGSEAMHNGSLTQRFVDDVRELGGIITVEDMNDYTPEWQSPITVRLNDDLTLYTNPLPGSGAVLAFLLNIWKGFIGGAEAPRHSNLYYHRIVETLKYAYALRTGLGDPNQPPDDLAVDIRALEANLSNPEYVTSFRSLVEDKHTYEDWRHYGAFHDVQRDHGTDQVIVVAPNGDVVSATSTINYIFGALRRSTSTGIILNNEMSDFAIPGTTEAGNPPPSPANALRAGMQPLSSMVPSIVLNRQGQCAMVVGSAGGMKITPQVAMTIASTFYEDDYYPIVVNRPRIHHQLIPMQVEHETDFDQDVVKSLQERGHRTTDLGPTAGFAVVIGAVLDKDGYYISQTDRRRGGNAAGF